MSDGRAEVLARIGRALGPAGARGTAPAVPAGYRRTSEDAADARLARFTERARGYKVRVEVTPRDAVHEAVARILGERGVVRLAVPRDLSADHTPEGFDLVRDEGLDNATIAGCDGVLTTSACAIAETGTLVLDHGVGQGRRALTLLPDYHLCLVLAADILGLVPEAVERMAPSVRAGRPLTFISGPSATSDIELSRVEGVHGPRTLDILVIAET